MLFRLFKRRRTDPGAYARAVIETLRGDFPDLQRAETAEIIYKAVYRQAASPVDGFEVLVDSGGNWRLKPHRDEPGRVRISCYRWNETAADRERAINARLDELPH